MPLTDFIRFQLPDRVEHLGYRVENGGDGSEALKEFQGMEREGLGGPGLLPGGTEWLRGHQGIQASGQSGSGAGGVRLFIIQEYGQFQNMASSKKEEAPGQVNKP